MGVVATGHHRSYLGIVVVVGIGLLLYFLPELVRFGKGSDKDAANSVVTTATKKAIEGSQESVKTETTEPKETEKKVVAQTKSGDPLTKVLARIDSGVFDPPTLDTKLDKNDRSPLANLMRSPKLSWDILARKEVTDTTKSALKSAQAMQKGLSPKYQRTSDALNQYVMGINNFSRGALKKLEPRVALDYLGKLDVDVTNALRLDAAPRRVYKQWAKISLGALVESSGANAKKKEYMPPFVSDVVLTKIDLKEDKVNKKKPIVPHSMLKIEAVVVGIDASEVEVYRNGELIGSSKLPKFKKDDLNRKFTFTHRGRAAIRGVFRFRMRDEEGLYLDKVYQFMPNASRFRLPRGGKFDLPVVYVDLARPVSRSLDKFFVITSGRGGVTYGDLKDAPAGYTAF